MCAAPTNNIPTFNFSPLPCVSKPTSLPCVSKPTPSASSSPSSQNTSHQLQQHFPGLSVSVVSGGTNPVLHLPAPSLDPDVMATNCSTLSDMFPLMHGSVIQSALVQCNGRLDSALDLLLTKDLVDRERHQQGMYTRTSNLCQLWVNGQCIEGRAAACRDRHFYIDSDSQLKRRKAEENVGAKKKLRFSSPYRERVVREQVEVLKKQVDVDSGKENKWMEYQERDLIDLTGGSSQLNADVSFNLEAGGSFQLEVGVNSQLEAGGSSRLETGGSSQLKPGESSQTQLEVIDLSSDDEDFKDTVTESITSDLVDVVKRIENSEVVEATKRSEDSCVSEVILENTNIKSEVLKVEKLDVKFNDNCVRQVEVLTVKKDKRKKKAKKAKVQVTKNKEIKKVKKKKLSVKDNQVEDYNAGNLKIQIVKKSKCNKKGKKVKDKIAQEESTKGDSVKTPQSTNSNAKKRAKKRKLLASKKVKFSVKSEKS